MEDVERRVVEHSVKHLVPGMEVVNDIYSKDGTVLVSSGAILNKQTIERFISWDIPAVKVYAEVIINPIIDPAVKKFMNGYNDTVQAVQNTFDVIRAGQDVPVDSLEATANSIAKDVKEVGNIVDQLYNLPPCDDYTFRHCVNVSIIAASIAAWLKYPVEIVNAIALTGLLHDIGKSKLPPEFLEKNRILTPEEKEHFKKHVDFGVELARGSSQIAESIILGIAQHHEREDGSGYSGLTADDIHPYAKIVAVADMYDEALTILEPSPFLSPYTCLEVLRDNAYQLKAKACITLVNKMTNYLSGNVVGLNDGRNARVVCINTDRPSRSVVRLDCGQVIDLYDEPELRIHHLIR